MNEQLESEVTAKLHQAVSDFAFDYRLDHIPAALEEWIIDGDLRYNCENAESFALVAKEIIRQLDTIDCAAAHAPSGLIYNHDLAEKLGEWAFDIRAALEGHEEATGESWSYTQMPHGGGTFFSYVWFAVEWWSNELAGYLRSKWDIEE